MTISRGKVGAFQRYLALLDVLATLPPGSPARLIVERSGVPRATAYRLLAELRTLEVIRDVEGHLLPGPALDRIATWARPYERLVRAARPLLDKLRDETGETVTLHVGQGRERFCLWQSLSTQDMHFATAINQSRRLDDGLPGKLLLAARETPERVAFVKWVHQVDGPELANRLQQALDEASAGYLVQSIPDFSAVGAIVPGRQFCICVVGPATRFTVENASATLHKVRSVAAALSDV